jgi:hypothetical protein
MDIFIGFCIGNIFAIVIAFLLWKGLVVWSDKQKFKRMQEAKKRDTQG